MSDDLVSELISNLEVQRTKVDQLEAENQALKTTNSELSQKCSDLEAKVKQLEETIQKLKIEAGNVQEE